MGKRCAGDCDESDDTTVDELRVLVDIALGELRITGCVAGDVDGNAAITVDEIIAAVNRALTHCPS